MTRARSLLWASVVASSAAAAQTAAPPAAPPAAPIAPPGTAPAAVSPTPPSTTVVITGNPLGRNSLVQPASVLSGDALTLRRAGTLAETLDGTPGMSQTWFGPNANRPVIRGLDGDRVRLLDNGGASIDASSLSFDHAVPIDPLAVDRIEVLRGPAALLYGGSAVGGVVNTIDNRIPRAPVEGLSGRAEARFGGAASERSGSAVIEGGAGSLAWHVDGFVRRTDDLKVPEYTPVADGEPLEPTDRVRNSESEAQGGAIGAGWVDPRGHAGFSLDTYRNDYGVTVEPDVLIRMKRDRVAFSAERRQLGGLIDSVSAQLSYTDYQHEEVEGSGEVGTTFDSTGTDLRLELRHAPIGGLTGVIGLQAENSDFSALGEEAFVPDTDTESAALFVLEEFQLGPLRLTGGLRGEKVRVNSKGDAPDAEEPKFGAPVSRRFSPASASFGVLWPLQGSGWSFSGSLAHTERAPAYYELYANGVHIATAAFERGDPTLGVERSNSGELGASYQIGPHSFKASVFRTDFSSFISLDATGAQITVPGEGGEPDAEVPEYAFRSVRARLTGAELEGRTRLVDSTWSLDLSAGADFVRGDNRDSNEPLPRIAPTQLRAGLEAAFGAWRTGADLRYAAEQDRVPATDTATDSYTRLNLWATWEMGGPALQALWFLRVDNVTDELAFNAGTIGTLRSLAPLPGRGVTAGVRVKF
jgi:iron complex outermembrane receptor protein